MGISDTSLRVTDIRMHCTLTPVKNINIHLSLFLSHSVCLSLSSCDEFPLPYAPTMLHYAASRAKQWDQATMDCNL